MNFNNMGSNNKHERLPPLPGGLARQSSVYSLTFDEFQNSLGFGKDFGSMNMDEFLKNICSAEETLAVTSLAVDGLPSGSGLQRQSSLALPRTISQKTVDEVCREIFSGGGETGEGITSKLLSQLSQQCHPNLGERTLEEFLVRAGVVREDFPESGGPLTDTSDINGISGTVQFGDFSGVNSSNDVGLGLGFQPSSQGNVGMAVNGCADLVMDDIKPSQFGAGQVGNNIDFGKHQVARGGGNAGISNLAIRSGFVPATVGYGTGGTAAAAMSSPTKLLPANRMGRNDGGLSSLSPVPYAFNGGFGKRSGCLEKVIERRQKRMIKNRESAARSRARKQAYTMELEAEIEKLKEQNEALQKKQVEILESKKNQLMKTITQKRGNEARNLRRTYTGPW